MRYPQIKRLDSPAALRERLAELGLDVPVADELDPHGVLARPVEVHDGSAGTLTVANRFAVLPMEGWDGTTDGRPTDLVRRRWPRFGASGCGLVWGEATAVRPDGRANPNQLVLDETTVDDVADLRALLDPAPGRRPAAHPLRPLVAGPTASPRPRIAYAHPLLDRRSAPAPSVLTDDELDELVERLRRRRGAGRSRPASTSST